MDRDEEPQINTRIRASGQKKKATAEVTSTNKLATIVLSPKSVDNVNWPPLSFKADVSSVSPSSERMGELWVVCIYMQKMEQLKWREHGNE